MRPECDVNGDFLLDPDLLAERFSLRAEDFRRLVRSGLVRGTVETGTGADVGRKRLTVRCGNRAWTAIVDSRNNVLSESFAILRRPPAKTRRAS